MEYKSGDSQLVEKFLAEFVRRLVEEFRESIDFVLLFGSAARGEWKRGASDVDLVIQLKAARKEDVQEFAEKLFWELDERHDTQFSKVCSTAKDDLLSALERRTRLYCPFEVLNPGEISWSAGEMHNVFFKLATETFAPKSMLLLKIKKEGKVLWGRNVVEEISPRVTLADRLRAILVPHHLSFYASLLSFFLPEKAVRLATKALLYESEAALFYLELPIGSGVRKAIEELEKIVRENPLVDYSMLRKALEYKALVSQGIRIRRTQAIKFAWKTFFFVVATNWTVIIKNLLRIKQRF